MRRGLRGAVTRGDDGKEVWSTAEEVLADGLKSLKAMAQHLSSQCDGAISTWEAEHGPIGEKNCGSPVKGDQNDADGDESM